MAHFMIIIHNLEYFFHNIIMNFFHNIHNKCYEVMHIIMNLL